MLDIVKRLEELALRPDIFGTQGQLAINAARSEIERLRSASKDAVAFFNRIEGHGYGGEAEFENARRGLQLVTNSVIECLRAENRTPTDREHGPPHPDDYVEECFKAERNHARS